MTPAQPIQAPVVPAAVTTAPPMAAPDINSSAPAPDLTLGQPAQPNRQTAMQGSYEAAVNNQQAAADKAAALAVPVAPPPPGPHARLAAMVQGLAIGLSSAGTALGTHGREGGAPEVQEFYANQQKQKIEAQQATMAQKNQQIQQQLTIGETNRQLAQSYLNLMTAPDEITAAHVKLQEEQTGLAEGQQKLAAGATEADAKAQDLFDTRNFIQPGYEVDPSTGQVHRTAPGQPAAGQPAATTPGVAPAAGQTPTAPAGTTAAPAGTTPAPARTTGATPAGAPATATSAVVPRDGQFFLRQQSLLNAGVDAITVANGGKTTPIVDAAKKILDDPKSTLAQINGAVIGITRQAGLSDATVKRIKDAADSQAAQTAAKYAEPKAQADIAKSRAQAASATSSQQKNAFELGQQQREATDLATPDAVGFSSKLGPKEYDKRYDSFTKSKDYQTLSTLKGSYQQFQDTLNHIAQTGDMTGAESVVGLFNAIGISATPLAGKGFRINSNTIEEHQEARGIDQAAYQKLLALKTGAVITPKQLTDYSNIAAGVYHNSFVNAADEAHRQGLPVDFLPQGGGRAPDPITARIYMDVVLHTHPELGNNPQAAQKAAMAAAGLNGWKVQ